MSESRLTRPVVLANGDRVPLIAAATSYGHLSDYLTDPDSDWDVVYYLREMCLGRDIEPEQSRALIHARLVEADGVPGAAMRAVVLSAVRGEGRHLHLDSPFTDPLDRSIAEFITARHYLHSFLDGSELKEVLDDPVRRALENPPPKRWTDREDDRPDPPGDLPPH